ncbi:B9 domain-containing protein [Paraphysoderma sedebokerense]|nr:B9 domain-containing protein [Paraphysoderma sedebokerense]
MAELHIIGTIQGAEGFPSADLSCKWQFEAGSNWKIIQGIEKGQTQVDLPLDGIYTVWSHPIDIHYTTKSIHGWPKINFVVYHQDRFGRHELYGYGFVHIPTSPGTYQLECVTWRPTGTLTDQISAFFLGTTPSLRSQSLVTSSADRFKLTTQAMGRIYVEVSVISKGFEQYGVVI